MKPSLEVADIFRQFGPTYRAQHGAHMPIAQLRAMHAIEVCRTAELGGHVETCDHCDGKRISYNSCRNRHCPKCQGLDKERWRQARHQDLLPTPYFHVVFTLPQALRPLALRNQEVVYSLLFKAASQALLELGRDRKYLGGQIGFTALLHTWSQTLAYHPHLHCIVPGGGVSVDGHRWISSRKSFFVPVKALSALFRGKMIAYLKQACTSGELIFPGPIARWQGKRAFGQLCRELYGRDWVVYCKPPFTGPEETLDYLARYTHRVALTNERLLKLEGEEVHFRYRDSANGNRMRRMKLPAYEFIRRFLWHILPDHFVKIRHYGLLSNRQRTSKLRWSRYLLGAVPPGLSLRPSWQQLLQQLTGIDPTVCPSCGQGKMSTERILEPLWQRRQLPERRRSA